MIYIYNIKYDIIFYHLDLLVHTGNKKTDGLFVGFITVFKFPANRTLPYCLHPGQSAPPTWYTTAKHPAKQRGKFHFS